MVGQNILVSLIPLLPLLGFITISLNVRSLSHVASSLIACGVVLLSFVLSLTVFFSLPEGNATFEVFLFNWIDTAGFTGKFGFLVDPLSSLMLLIITGVGFLIHVYSIGYMHDDPGYNRFFSYLNLFVFFMLLLVMGSNFLMMFIGWEGVGLCSYLLIGFWFKNQSYNDAANKAFIMNRIGDLGMLLAIILVFVHFGTIEFSEVFAKAHGVDAGMITVLTLLLFVGATGKSAQLPLYTWLPDAMAGPTPVSALIHAATMVTAGIYMIARNNLLFTLSPITLDVISIVGLGTALLAATIAIAQNDIKKVLAYSTVSQLGLMFLALGVGAYSTGVFHMATHAFFKALLFLGAGSVIHALHGEQDIRKMGGLKSVIPVTFYTFLIGVVAISGIPPFAGFFSKDEILTKAFEHNPLLWGGAVLVSLLTAFYMFRLLFLTFFSSPRATADVLAKAHESPSVMTIPLIILAVLSVTAGFIGMPAVFHAPHVLGEFLAPVFGPSLAIQQQHVIDHSTEYILMGIILSATVVVITAAYGRYVGKNHVPVSDTAEKNAVHTLVLRKYFVDEIYNNVIVKGLYGLSSFFERIVENLGIDKLVNGVGVVVTSGSKTIRLFQSGSIGFYIFLMVLGTISILILSILL
jgi:NADH-quinone oxidoreductase subunit L